MPLEPAIQGAARQAEGFGRLAHIAAGTRQRFLNEDALHFFEAHALERRGAVPSPPPGGGPQRAPAALVPPREAHRPPEVVVEPPQRARPRGPPPPLQPLGARGRG